MAKQEIWYLCERLYGYGTVEIRQALGSWIPVNGRTLPKSQNPDGPDKKVIMTLPLFGDDAKVLQKLHDLQELLGPGVNFLTGIETLVNRCLKEMPK